MNQRALTGLATLLLVACGGRPEAGKDLLAGTWKVDFDKTWEVSEAGFLKDDMRGGMRNADAYPKDPAEKAAAVKTEMGEFLKDVTLTLNADGTGAMSIQGGMKGTYKVLGTDGATMTLKENISNMFGKWADVTIEFKSDHLLHWAWKRPYGPTLVLERQ